jgi:flagellar basal body rod protein FlgC
MGSTFAIGLSGLRLAQTRLGVAGHNIANLSTPDFRRQEVAASTGASGGVTATLQAASRPGAALETDVVSLLEAKASFAANLQVFKSAERMLGTWLDTTG